MEYTANGLPLSGSFNAVHVLRERAAAMGAGAIPELLLVVEHGKGYVRGAALSTLAKSGFEHLENLATRHSADDSDRELAYESLHVLGQYCKSDVSFRLLLGRLSGPPMHAEGARAGLAHRLEPGRTSELLAELETCREAPASQMANRLLSVVLLRRGPEVDAFLSGLLTMGPDAWRAQVARECLARDKPELLEGVRSLLSSSSHALRGLAIEAAVCGSPESAFRDLKPLLLGSAPGVTGQIVYRLCDWADRHWVRHRALALDPRWQALLAPLATAGFQSEADALHRRLSWSEDSTPSKTVDLGEDGPHFPLLLIGYEINPQDANQNACVSDELYVWDHQHSGHGCQQLRVVGIGCAMKGFLPGLASDSEGVDDALARMACTLKNDGGEMTATDLAEWHSLVSQHLQLPPFLMGAEAYIETDSLTDFESIEGLPVVTVVRDETEPPWIDIVLGGGRAAVTQHTSDFSPKHMQTLRSLGQSWGRDSPCAFLVWGNSD